ncbi:MAG: bifunctional diaminohydroxyphosphoribosylaminopyrimidine deaminase/5-amino-6-(5-phosphoribosylamino)uracil reductase RibD [Flavobacteriaceae bacterium]|nr:bifunctional diaminohydroxyphosphoribosylaminopyrimidine deaminase/5-amino-6-(5-phosphoribosylamino)uracil reductase RibD [Flavobacteriaceae bacterium]
MKIHEIYISRCIELSKKGLGTTRPNPMVGCVIVCDSIIIGEGYTSPYGGNHAEVNAIAAVEDISLLKNATLYVSLEPCSHFGKTPPCSNLIVSSGIKKVVVGVVDDNSLVSGKGIDYLKSNGVEVIVGVLEDACKEVNKRFFTFHQRKRPYVILKWAETKDGFIDKIRKEGEPKVPTWISNQYAQQLVHKWRSEEQAILVGTNTVIQDNPKLNVRSWVGENPIRLVLDRTMRIPADVNVFDNSVKTIVFTGKELETALEKDNLEFVQIDFSENIPAQVCELLYQQEIQSVIIEGGTQTLQSFINADLWDEARVFVGDVVFGKGVKAPLFKGEVTKMEQIGSTVLKIVTP